jgi:CRISPR/Cas system-associated exonuclease Cas4 (RecB family)
MLFDEEKSITMRTNLSTFSKSFGETFKLCPLKAWFKARDKRKEEKPSKELLIGKFTHELFAQKVVEEHMNKKYKVNIKGIDPTVIYESKVMLSRLNLDTIIEKDDTVIAVEEFHKVFMKNGLELVGIFDLVLLKQSSKGPYIQVFDLKTGYKLAKEVDLQCMIYAYLAAMTYPGLPVLFTTFSSRNGDTWGKFFSEKEALSLGDIIENFSGEVKEIVEDEYRPVSKPSPNCLHCPFFDECLAAQNSDETNILLTMEEYQKTKNRLKQLETILKNFRASSSEDKAIEAGQYLVDYSESLSTAIATKGTTKDDLKVLIANSKGGLNQILDSIDIKLTDKVIALAKEHGVEFKPKSTKRLVIKSAVEDLEEGEDDE